MSPISKALQIGYKTTCPGCRSTEIHEPMQWPLGNVKYAARRCRIKRLELDAKQYLRNDGVKWFDVDHPIMVEYRRIIKEHWEESYAKA